MLANWCILREAVLQTDNNQTIGYLPLRHLIGHDLAFSLLACLTQYSILMTHRSVRVNILFNFNKRVLTDMTCSPVFDRKS